MKTFLGRTKGFTLIELLIVIAVLGILIVAVLSAIDPVEQIRKSRDSARRSDARTLLDGSERFYSTYQCMPWDTIGCAGVATNQAADAVDTADLNAGSTYGDLITEEELKPAFQNRQTITNSELFLSATALQVAVCFEPESTAGRNGAYGATVANNDGTGGAATCTPDAYPDASCYVCLPQ